MGVLEIQKGQQNKAAMIMDARNQAHDRGINAALLGVEGRLPAHRKTSSLSSGKYTKWLNN